jgi:hypothetical protein
MGVRCFPPAADASIVGRQQALPAPTDQHLLLGGRHGGAKEPCPSLPPQLQAAWPQRRRWLCPHCRLHCTTRWCRNAARWPHFCSSLCHARKFGGAQFFRLLHPAAKLKCGVRPAAETKPPAVVLRPPSRGFPAPTWGSRGGAWEDEQAATPVRGGAGDRFTGAATAACGTAPARKLIPALTRVKCLAGPLSRGPGGDGV